MTTAKAPQFLYEGTLTFGSVTNSTSTTTDITVTLPNNMQFPHSGTAGDGAVLALELPNLQAGLMFCNPQAISATQFKVRFFNPTGGALTPTGTNAKLVMF